MSALQKAYTDMLESRMERHEPPLVTFSYRASDLPFVHAIVACLEDRGVVAGSGVLRRHFIRPVEVSFGDICHHLVVSHRMWSAGGCSRLRASYMYPHLWPGSRGDFDHQSRAAARELSKKEVPS